MDYRNLGHTGMYVSPLCLGAMMFGAWGDPDHDDSVAHHPPRRSTPGINFIDTADVYSAGRVGGRSSARRCKGRRDDVVLATKFHGPMDVPMGTTRRPEPARQLPALDRPGGREQPAPAAAPTGSTSTRCTGPTRAPTIDETLAALTDLVQRQGKIRAFGSLDLPGAPDRRGAVDRRSAAASGGS